MSAERVGSGEFAKASPRTNLRLAEDMLTGEVANARERFSFSRSELILAVNRECGIHQVGEQFPDIDRAHEQERKAFDQYAASLRRFNDLVIRGIMPGDLAGE